MKSNEGTMRLRGFAVEAWEEFKAGVDKAWDEIKISVDKSIKTTSEGFARGWEEISFGAGKAKDSLLGSKSDVSARAKRTKMRKKKEEFI